VLLLETFKALHGILCADVPLRNYSITQSIVWCLCSKGSTSHWRSR